MGPRTIEAGFPIGTGIKAEMVGERQVDAIAPAVGIQAAFDATVTQLDSAIAHAAGVKAEFSADWKDLSADLSHGAGISAHFEGGRMRPLTAS